MLVSTGVERIWNGLPAYDEANVPQWLGQVVPLVTAGQRQSVALTEAFLARSLKRQPIGVNPDDVISSVRPGVAPEEQWRRPFVTVWTALSKGSPYVDAVGSGLARADGMAAFDIQASMRATAGAVQRADPQIQRWQRVADGGACAFCQEVDGAILMNADALPLHNNCGCSIEPLLEVVPTTPTPSAVAIHDHGEMGPMLTDPAQSFTSEAATHG